MNATTKLLIFVWLTFIALALVAMTHGLQIIGL